MGDARVAGIMPNTADPGFPDGWTTYFASADARATADLADESGGQPAMAPMEVPQMGDAMLELVQTLGGTVIDGADDSPYGRLATLSDPMGAPFTVMTPTE